MRDIGNSFLSFNGGAESSASRPRRSFRFCRLLPFTAGAIRLLAVVSIFVVSCAIASAQVPVSFTPGRVIFPNQAAGTTSAPLTLTLTNNQAVALNVTNIQIVPISPVVSPFSKTADTCIGTPVPAGQSCTITLTYSPPAVGFSSSTLTVTDDAPTSPQMVAVSGNAVAALSISPKNGLTFAAQVIGRASSPQVVTVTNNSSGAIAINPPAISGADAADFNLSANTCGASVPANSSCTISFTFLPGPTPPPTSFRSGTVTLSFNAFGSPITFALGGTAIAGDTGVSLTVAPFTSCVMPSQSEQFTAAVTNSGNTAVNWLVDGLPGGSGAAGTISAGGVYTAPSAEGSHVIQAVSQADNTAASQATVTVTQSPSLGVFPGAASVLISTSQTFQAQICTVPDSNATFSVDKIPGGSAAVGTISSSGLYTAPAAVGRHTVTATDSSLNKSSGAPVTVYGDIEVDFGVRKNPAYPLAPELIGAVQVDDLHNASDIALVADVVSASRTNAQIQTVYKTQTPDFTNINARIASLLAAGLHPILQLVSTPPFLQPNPNPCGAGNANVPPSDVNRWGQLAASYVADMDANFPGLVQDYEIWNEPDTGLLCGKNINDYLAIYAAAAPLMKAVNSNIRIGGPAVAGLDTTFISPLLTNGSTAPFVDFISYHQYPFGASTREAAWDTYTGVDSVYQKLQEPGDGISAYFLRAGALASAGAQPMHGNTPIFLDEFNVNNAFLPDCCKNDPVFSPLFNGLTTADLLNSVYFGAPRTPGNLTYFAANAYPYFCLVGTLDSFRDCQYSVGSTPDKYPQYFLFQLLSSPAYLGLKAGGNLAPAVTPQTSAGGLAVSGFTTATTPPQDNILIVNPNNTPYSQIPIQIQNTGFISATAVVDQIVNGNSITQTSLPLTASLKGTSTYTATIDVPAYTVLGIAIQGTPDPNPKSIQAVVSASPEPSSLNAPFTVTATLAALQPGGPVPTGTVQLEIDGIGFGGTLPLVNGVASATRSNSPSAVPAGSHLITAIYSGDANYKSGQTFSGTHVVTATLTSTKLTANPNPAVAGTPVTFTATVMATGSAPGPAPGTVNFTDGATPIGTGTLDANGVATLTTSALTVGSHTITATYLGQNQFASSSASVVEVITPAPVLPTTTTLTSSLNPSQFTQNVTFTATVTSSGGIPTGSVTFIDGGTTLGPGTLDATGVATLSTSTLAAGTHPITAAYQGAPTFMPSTSATLSQVVTPLPGDFSIAIVPASVSVNRGIPAAYDVNITAINGFAGVVNFTCSIGTANKTTCGFNPTTVVGSGTTLLTVLTTPAHPSSKAENRAAPTTLVMAGLFCAFLLRRRRLQMTALLVLLVFVGGTNGCGSSGDLGTLPGKYTVTVTATSANSNGIALSHSASSFLQVH